MAARSIGLVGPAGSGKSTIAHLINTVVAPDSYHRHALADPIKVALAYPAIALFGQSRGRSLPDYRVVTAAIRGKTGIVNGAFSHEQYVDDRRQQAALIDHVNANKAIFRTSLQQYGEAMRFLYAPREPWVDAFLGEALLDRHLGMATICDDIRRLHEAEALRERGFVIVGVTRDRPDGAGMTDATRAHITEQEIAAIPVDVTFDNNGPIETLPERLATLLIHVNFAANVAA